MNWSYSNTGYILLGLVVEKATGTTLKRQLRTRIFVPLGLTRTSLPSLPTLRPPVAHGYLLPGNEIIPVDPKRRLDVTVQAVGGLGGGGTGLDCGRRGPVLRGALRRQAARPDLLRQMTRTVVVSGSFGYGLGVGKSLTGCGDGWGREGSVPGYGSLALSTRDGSRQVVILINTSPRETTPTSPVFGRVSEALVTAFCP